MRIRLLLPILLFALLQPARACYVYVPLQVRLVSAEAVVLGKIVQVREEGTKQIGTIEVRKVLLGNPKMRTVELSWPKPPPPGGPMLADGPMRYRDGMDGVWVLNQQQPGEPMVANYPGDYMNLENAKKVLPDIKAARQLVWSPAENGLQMAVVYEVKPARNGKVHHQGKQVDALAQVTLYPLLRNGGESTFEVCDFAGDQPVRIVASGPDGSEVQADLYGKGNPNMKPNKWSFRPLAPGAVRQLGYGFMMPPVTVPGPWSYQVSYRNEREGGELGFTKVWKGELAAEGLRIPIEGK